MKFKAFILGIAVFTVIFIVVALDSIIKFIIQNYEYFIVIFIIIKTLNTTYN